MKICKPHLFFIILFANFIASNGYFHNLAYYYDNMYYYMRFYVCHLMFDIKLTYISIT